MNSIKIKRHIIGLAAAVAAMGFTGAGLADLTDMVFVGAGEYVMGDTFGYFGDIDERPPHDVFVSSFYMDMYETTNAEFIEFLNDVYGQGLIEFSDGVVYKAGDSERYCLTNPTGSTYTKIAFIDGTFLVLSGRHNHPVSQVSWYGVQAYCNWRSEQAGLTPCYDLETWSCDWTADGYRMPTNAEWEKAAGWDPDLEYHYRFGEGTDGCGHSCLSEQRANYFGNEFITDPWDDQWSLTTPVDETTPVGFYDGSLHLKADFDWPGSMTSFQTQNAQSPLWLLRHVRESLRVVLGLVRSTVLQIHPLSGSAGLRHRFDACDLRRRLVALSGVLTLRQQGGA